MAENGREVDTISVTEAKTLDGLFAERVRRTPDAAGYREYDEAEGRWRDHTWQDMHRQVARWQHSLNRDGVSPGDRVAVMLRNCTAWVIYDQAAMGLGAVVVPLYTQDRPDNVAYIVKDSGAKVLLLESAEQWRAFESVRDQLGGLVRVLLMKRPEGGTGDERVLYVERWLPEEATEVAHVNADPMQLASIVYTSGTTGRPKGVMLSHNNMLTNAYAATLKMAVRRDDVFLSFLPLSHTFERTVGYYLTVMTGALTAYARSVQALSEDLVSVRPTILISVPRIYERVYGAIQARLAEGPAIRGKLFQKAVDVGWRRFEHAQGRASWSPSLLLWPLLDALVAGKIRARLGGNLRAALSGGAALPPDISRVFIGLGLTILQGYGLTESSPIISANSLEDNVPASVGTPIRDVEVRVGENDALHARGPNIMMGYWNNPEATATVFTADGWLNTGDTARIDEAGHIFITGRLKEIIVLSNGEKVPPVDIEAAIMRDPLFEQVLLIGEGKSYLSAIAVLKQEEWEQMAAALGVDGQAEEAVREESVLSRALERLGAQMREFPGYAQVRRITLTLEPWTVENGLLTPTMKLKRAKVMEKFYAELDAMYVGH
ncbi:MAG: AMP-binding protein [Betaproteobacteria bacterium]|nr:AMP-binding protein [Betaproteobacteria bacterium]